MNLPAFTPVTWPYRPPLTRVRSSRAAPFLKWARLGSALALALVFVTTEAAGAGAPPERAPLPYDRAQLSKSLEACAHLFPRQQALALDFAGEGWQPVGLCSDQFAVVYSVHSKTALVVVEKLNRATLESARSVPRKDAFFADPRLSRKEAAELRDYRNQSPAVDRGHLAPASNAATTRAMVQSFALSNMVPQDPEHNRGSWRKIESDVQKYIRRAQGDVYVYTGPLFQPPLRTVGPGQVWVPSHLFKLVYDPAAEKAWVYVSANAPGPVKPPLSYAAFVEFSGLRLLPAAAVLR